MFSRDVSVKFRFAAQILNSNVPYSLAGIENQNFTPAPTLFDGADNRRVNCNPVALNLCNNAVKIEIKRFPLASSAGRTRRDSIHTDFLYPLLIPDTADNYVVANAQTARVVKPERTGSDRRVRIQNVPGCSGSFAESFSLTLNRRVLLFLCGDENGSVFVYTFSAKHDTACFNTNGFINFVNTFFKQDSTSKPALIRRHIRDLINRRLDKLSGVFPRRKRDFYGNIRQLYASS